MRRRVWSVVALACGVALARGEAGAQPRRAGTGRARRGPVAELSYRYTSLALHGADGATHGLGVGVFPLRAGPSLRWLRLGMGLEGALRVGPNDHTDLFVMATTSVGWQGAYRVAVPFVAAVVGAGFEVEARFGKTYGRFAYVLGAEAGVNVRVAGPLGVGLAAGVGRTVEGAVYHDAAWLRAIVPLF